MSIIFDLERKLNPSRFFKRDKADKQCRISINLYYDWLIHIDDDYLTEYEHLKMKDLYQGILAEMAAQTVVFSGIAYFVSYPLLGPFFRSAHHFWHARFPTVLCLALFFNVQARKWMRPEESFHQLMC